MLAIIIGIVLILGGPAWGLLSWLAVSMADRGVDSCTTSSFPDCCPASLR